MPSTKHSATTSHSDRLNPHDDLIKPTRHRHLPLAARYDVVTNDDLGRLDTDGVYDLIFAVQPTGS